MHLDEMFQKNSRSMVVEQASTWGMLKFRPEDIISWSSYYTPWRVKTVLLPFLVLNTETGGTHKTGMHTNRAQCHRQQVSKNMPSTCSSQACSLYLWEGSTGAASEVRWQRGDPSGTAVGCYATGEEESGAMQTLLSKALIWELTVPGISLVSWHLLIEAHVASWLIKVLNN